MNTISILVRRAARRWAKKQNSPDLAEHETAATDKHIKIQTEKETEQTSPVKKTSNRKTTIKQQAFKSPEGIYRHHLETCKHKWHAFLLNSHHAKEPPLTNFFLLKILLKFQPVPYYFSLLLKSFENQLK